MARRPGGTRPSDGRSDAQREPGLADADGRSEAVGGVEPARRVRVASSGCLFVLASLDSGQHQRDEAEQDLVGERDHVGDEEVENEQRCGDDEEVGETQAAEIAEEEGEEAGVARVHRDWSS